MNALGLVGLLHASGLSHRLREYRNGLTFNRPVRLNGFLSGVGINARILGLAECPGWVVTLSKCPRVIC